MARKLPALERVLGAPALFSVAYGEIASSIYVALGIVAGHALGLTPVEAPDRWIALPDRVRGEVIAALASIGLSRIPKNG